MELLCPAGNLPALKAAVDNGADAVYVGLNNDTNARHFKGLNFTPARLQQGIEYAHRHQCHVHVAVNTFAHPGREQDWFHTLDIAAEAGADAFILADVTLLEYAATHYPDIARHLSVQASATHAAAIRFYQRNFGITRVVLPRVLAVKQVFQLARDVDIELEVFAFGSLCIMSEGRCYLSSYVTGESPNTVGACSPAKYVRWENLPNNGMNTRLNGFLIDHFEANENAGYPTLCKGRFCNEQTVYHAIEEPTSLNTLALLPELQAMGIQAVKIEGRQRSPAYVATVTRHWRHELDRCQHDPQHYQPGNDAEQALAALSEGTQTTLGPYYRSWQ